MSAVNYTIVIHSIKCEGNKIKFGKILNVCQQCGAYILYLADQNKRNKFYVCYTCIGYFGIVIFI